MMGSVLPAAAFAAEPSSTPLETHRQETGGAPKSHVEGGTLGDAGIVEGPSGALRAAAVASPAKGGAPGGTLRGAVAPGGDAQALRGGASGSAKGRVGGGSLRGDVGGAPASPLRAGAEVGSRKSGVRGGTLSTVSAQPSGASTSLRSSSEPAPKH
jgi:hypothetical protein